MVDADAHLDRAAKNPLQLQDGARRGRSSQNGLQLVFIHRTARLVSHDRARALAVWQGHASDQSRRRLREIVLANSRTALGRSSGGTLEVRLELVAGLNRLSPLETLDDRNRRLVGFQCPLLDRQLVL